jgi:hypothetical protein
MMHGRVVIPIRNSTGELVAYAGRVGYLDAVDGYHVSFRMSPDAAKGSVTIQVTAAWITSAPVSISVQ